jgi:hypothetical protein
MSYSSAQLLAESAKLSTDDQDIIKLADAIHELGRAIERDMEKFQREIDQLKRKIK